MKPFGAAATNEEQALERVLAAEFGAGAADLSYAPAGPAIASPMRQGVDSAGWSVGRTGAAPDLFVKLRHQDAAPFVDMGLAYAAAAAAGAAEVAPATRFFNAALHAAGFAHLGPGWRPARMNDLQAPAVLHAIVAAKRRFHATGADLPPIDPFVRIETAKCLAVAASAELPDDFGWMLDNVRDIGTALAVHPHVPMPCHGDGTASNFMLGSDGAVMLVDFDAAGMAEPLYDLGVLFNEAFQFETEIAAALRSVAPEATEAAFHRCRLHGIADDFFWGMWGAVMAATSARRGVEFLKYGSWRLLRCRLALRDPRFEERLRQVEGGAGGKDIW